MKYKKKILIGILALILCSSTFISGDWNDLHKSLRDTNTKPVTAATPEPYTVENYKIPVTMWATQTVNYRDGASISCIKQGNLKKYEEVQVTGVTSTGWYEITRADGTKVYVSNKYLSEENPSDRTVYKYNKETGKIETYEFIDTPPEVIDRKIAELNKAPEPTAEPTVEPTVAPTAEPTITPTPAPKTKRIIDITGEDLKETAKTNPETVKDIKIWKTLVFGTIGFSIFVIIISIIMILRCRKRRR